MRRALIFIWLCLLCAPAKGQRKRIDLSGAWTFKLAKDSMYTAGIHFPGTLETNGKGKRVTAPSTQYLNQQWKYVGAAWYQKKITIPAQWQNKQLELFLERTKATQVWIDDKFAGKQTLLSAPQVYNIAALQPGVHTITIMVDNSPNLFSVGGSHALSEHTQTNWNGIIGEMYLEATGQVKINQVKITPDVKNKKADVTVSIRNIGVRTLTVTLQATSFNSKQQHVVQPVTFKAALNNTDTVLQFSYPLGKDALLWDEYHPALYKLTVSLPQYDTVVATFGLREFKPAGTQFSMNGNITFLRGKNDGCIFPLTGHPPMDIPAWRRVYRIAKRYGINHYRFHSYTPPRAAFEAADLEGIYIQCELPNWASFTIKDTTHTNFQYREGQAILDTYGNYASFLLFTLGNELGGDKAIHNKMVKDFRKYDGRRLYADGTNAFFADPQPGETDDFWVTMRTGKEAPGGKYDVRASFATSEDEGNGILNTGEPNTRRSFITAIKDLHLPVIGHETGQYQIYPDYAEMKKYTGVLKPLNFGIFKKRLEDAGMGPQAKLFFQASGKLTALLYREEIEMALRTPGFAGFQLLDLQDYPGQGTALVGLLDAFMESKGLISPEEFRRFNNDVVLQLLMDKYTWSNNETFTADVQLVNYSPKIISGKTIQWAAFTTDGKKKIAGGKLLVSAAEQGRINPLGNISFPLQSITAATKLLLTITSADQVYKAEYPVWVYPQQLTMPLGVKVSRQLDEDAMKTLQQGGSVVLFPDQQDNTVGPQFISEFWNWLVFNNVAKSMKRRESAGTLGILTNPEHPLFTHFPTEFYTNWQWWSIVKHTRPFILDQTEKAYRPIVQVIDNIDRNHKLGMIFEFKAGKGKLLVCMADLPAILNRPEARQLYYSMLTYAASEQFNPQAVISPTLFSK